MGRRHSIGCAPRYDGATGNIYAGLHEFADMAFTLHFLRPDDLFLDVGANIGSYTLLASGVCKARTISFEPDPARTVVLEQAAVGGEGGEVEFTIGRDTGNHVIMRSRAELNGSRCGHLTV